jgi:fructokinase
LAQRTRFNRGQLERLLARLPAGSLRLFDVNLRAPHDDLALARELAGRATMLKLNADEAARFAGAFRGEEANARLLADTYDCESVCITAGERGAGWLYRGNWYWEQGRRVFQVDPVGAGDAFVAALLASHLKGLPPADSLARACRLGELVASQSGATPAYGEA